MQLILRPVSDARLSEIIVTESRFAIGRNEEHFAAYERSIVAKLSRRHARIFERDGVAYIADLHSSNGTTVNGEIVEGEPVESARQLRRMLREVDLEEGVRLRVLSQGRRAFIFLKED